MASLINIVFMSLAEIVGDFGWKKFAHSGSLSSFTSGSLGYLGVIFYLIKSLRGSSVILVNGLWDGISAIIESLFAIFIMGESLGSWVQYSGLLLIIMGTFMLKTDWRPKVSYS